MVKILGIIFAAGFSTVGYRYMVKKSKKLDENQHVVIIGGGYGGIRLAKEISGRGRFTLVDPKEVLHHNMAALRAAVQPGFAKLTFVPYEPTFGQNFVQGSVTAVDLEEKQVVIDSKESIPFTQLVIATGSSGPFPGKCSHHPRSLSKLAQVYEDYTEQVKNAQNIVIVGGGAVGVEMAGEIADSYPGQKQITILHSGNVIVSSKLSMKARDKIMAKLKELNVQVIYNEKVCNLHEVTVPASGAEKHLVRTASGKVLDADLVIPCFGLSVNSDAYGASMPNCVNSIGQLKVNPNLQVIGHEDVFAIGDCNDFDVTKLATEAQAQASKTFDNLVAIGKGKPVEPYSPGMFRMVVPIGSDGGIAQAGTIVLGDFFARMIKAKDVFIKMTWKDEMSQQVPTTDVTH